MRFECEKCGARRPINKYNEKTLYADGTTDFWGNAAPCLVCNPPEPTYGPLTVDVVAEALCEADGVGYPVFVYRKQARLVLRMLKKLDAQLLPRGDINKVHDWYGEPVDWRDWLLRIAKEKP